MKKQEAIVISAYTGFLMCEFSDMHKYVEKLMGRPVFTHEMANDEFMSKLRKKLKPDFIKICESVK